MEHFPSDWIFKPITMLHVNAPIDSPNSFKMLNHSVTKHLCVLLRDAQLCCDLCLELFSLTKSTKRQSTLTTYKIQRLVGVKCYRPLQKSGRWVLMSSPVLMNSVMLSDFD